MSAYDDKLRATHFAHEQWVDRNTAGLQWDPAMAGQFPGYAENALDCSATADQDADFMQLATDMGAL